MLVIFLACWAPEIVDPSQPVATASPQKSPAEENHNISTQHIPTKEQEELDQSARNPPYTAWTIEQNVELMGPNGGIIFTLPKRGTRIEVQRIVPGYAQVICSGCAPPQQNQGGWVYVQKIALEWDLPEGDPLLKMLELRRNWLRNKDTPDNLQDRNAICMLFNGGYTQREGQIEWSAKGGTITLMQSQENWLVKKTKAPTVPIDASWRCDIQYPSKDDGQQQ